MKLKYCVKDGIFRAAVSRSRNRSLSRLNPYSGNVKLSALLLQKLQNGSPQCPTVVQISGLGAIRSVPRGFQSQAYGVGPGILGDPIFTDPSPERVVVGSSDTQVWIKTQGFFGKVNLTKVDELGLVFNSLGRHVIFGGCKEEGFAVSRTWVVQIDEE